MAAIAPGTRVVVVGCGRVQPDDLARLGLDVWACDPDPQTVQTIRAASSALDPARVTQATPTALGYPDTFGAWAALDLGAARDGPEALAEATRTVALGGWIWVSHPAGTDALMALELPVGVVPAEAPRDHDDGGTVIVRRVDDSVVG